LSAREVGQYCSLGRDARSLLSTAIARMGLSARAYHRVLKLARTCADLSAAPNVRFIDVAEAIKLRALDRATCC
jgi:magnesium chelatase family protein